MPPSRGDTICGHVVIDALAPMLFGARAFGPVFLAHTPEEPRMWLTAIDRTLLPRSYDVSRFMAGVGELLHVSVPGAVDVVLVDRESDFCIVGHRSDPRARTLATLAEAGADERAAVELGTTLAQTLADLHLRGMLHGLLTPATVVRAGQRWMTWQHGIVKWCVHDRLGPRLRPPGGDPIAPEIRAGEPSSQASDVFAWGATVACLLTGAVGSEAITLLEIDAREDPLYELVRRCLDPLPELRPQDGGQLLQRLEAIVRATPRGAEWEEDSGEVSFAELFDDLEPAASATGRGASARREVASLREELVELFDVEAQEDEPSESPPEDEPPPIAVVSAVPVPIAAPVVETPSWRELAERYVAEVRLTPRSPQLEERAPPRPSDEVVAASTSAADLARVALVRARVRTGPSRPVRTDPSAMSGEWRIPDDPDDEPEYPPTSDANAPALPSGVRVSEFDADEPPLYAFPDPETGEIIIAGPDWVPRSSDEEEDDAPGPDDTPRLVPMPGPPGSRRTAAARKGGRSPSGRASGPVPSVDASEPADVSQRLALVLATIGAIAALAMTVSAAHDAGGFDRLFSDASDSRTDATTTVVAVADVREPGPVCSPAMAPIPGAQVCIDRGEFPGVGELPRTHVSLSEAEHACSDRGMRLCTQGEWRSACRGDADADHPYGPVADPTACNGADVGAPTATLDLSGSRPTCVNDVGVFDLEGNVAEWVEGGAAMGGDAMTTAPSCARRAQPGGDTRAPTLGFRCCASASAAAP